VGEAIRQVGRGSAIDTGEVLLHLAENLVPENDPGHFLKIAKEEIAALHEGNFARYRLRLSEFMDWQNRKIKSVNILTISTLVGEKKRSHLFFYILILKCLNCEPFGHSI
jgi:hypothetical protein